MLSVYHNISQYTSAYRDSPNVRVTWNAHFFILGLRIVIRLRFADKSNVKQTLFDLHARFHTSIKW